MSYDSLSWKSKKFRVPFLENKFRVNIGKLQEIPFMIFDRNEIRIQALVVFSNGKLIICNPHLRKIIFKYLFTNHKKSETKIETHRTTLVPRTYRFRKKRFLMSRLTKIIFVQDDSILFLVFLLSILVIIRRSPGPDFYQIFEVPGIIQKALEYDRGP